MFVNIGLVGVFNATELIYAVYRANKGGFDSLIELYIYCMLACSLSSVQPGEENNCIVVLSPAHFMQLDATSVIHLSGRCALYSTFHFMINIRLVQK